VYEKFTEVTSVECIALMIHISPHRSTTLLQRYRRSGIVCDGQS